MALCLMAAAPLAAQGGNDNKKARQQQLQGEKIAFFTMTLDLTPEEAPSFWAIYNQYSKESFEAHKTAMQALRKMKENKLADAELEKTMDEYSKALAKEASLISEYAEKFKKVLPLQKVAKVFIAEDDFRMMLIHRFRNGNSAGNNPPDPQGPHRPAPDMPGCIFE